MKVLYLTQDKYDDLCADWAKVLAHWSRLSTGAPKEGESVGWPDCIFCLKFNNLAPNVPVNGCQGCPIEAITGKSGCMESPHTDVMRTFRRVYHEARRPRETNEQHSARVMTNFEFKAKALIELNWLEAAFKKWKENVKIVT